MFGTRRRLGILEIRLQKLIEERRVESQRRQAEETDPDSRMRILLNAVGDELETKLRQAITHADRAAEVLAEITRLRDQARTEAGAEGSTSPRFDAKLNLVYQAQWTGYVSLYFAGGYTDKVRLLIGSTNPPEDCVCTLNTRNDINTYAGGVVRAGEFWMAASMHEKGSSHSGVKCVFTPFL